MGHPWPSNLGDIPRDDLANIKNMDGVEDNELPN